MPANWTHPELGEFEWHLLSWCWRTKLTDPAFADFRYLHDEETQVGEVTLGIVADDSDQQMPARDAVKSLDQFWNRRQSLVGEILDYIWSDLSGELDSGTWWSSAPSETWDTMLHSTGLSRPTSEIDLFVHLGLPCVQVRYMPEETGATTLVNPFTGEVCERKPGIPRPGFWAVEFTFSCAWEREHDLGVLWYNSRFAGIGYGDGQLWPAKDFILPEDH